MIKPYVLPVAMLALLSGCSVIEPSGVETPSSSIAVHARTVQNFSDLSCQVMPLAPGKDSFKTMISPVNDKIELGSGESPAVAYKLPETGLHQVTIASSVVRQGKGTEEVFYPEVALLDQQGNLISTVSADQVEYQKPGLLTDEGVITRFTVDNRSQTPATCMVIYTTDKARQTQTKLINEAKEYAKIRGTVPVPEADTFARHGNIGKLAVTLKSSAVYGVAPVVATGPLQGTPAPTTITEADPFNKTFRNHYLQKVGDSLKQGKVTQALDQRSELKEITRATEGFFVSQYQNHTGQVLKPYSGGNANDFAAKAVSHYQEKIAGYFKEGKASSALKVVDDIRKVQDEVDQLFDRKS